jgi:hypothetical protein
MHMNLTGHAPCALRNGIPTYIENTGLSPDPDKSRNKRHFFNQLQTLWKNPYRCILGRCSNFNQYVPGNCSLFVSSRDRFEQSSPADYG